MLIFTAKFASCQMSRYSFRRSSPHPHKMTKNNKSVQQFYVRSGHRKRVVSPAQVAQDADPEERSRRERNKLEKRDRIRQTARLGSCSSAKALTARRRGRWRRGRAWRVARAVSVRHRQGRSAVLVMHDRLADATDRAFATLPTKAPLHRSADPPVLCAAVSNVRRAATALATAFIATCQPGARGPNADRIERAHPCVYVTAFGAASRRSGWW